MPLESVTEKEMLASPSFSLRLSEPVDVQSKPTSSAQRSIPFGIPSPSCRALSISASLGMSPSRQRIPSFIMYKVACSRGFHTPTDESAILRTRLHLNRNRSPRSPEKANGCDATCNYHNTSVLLISTFMPADASCSRNSFAGKANSG